MCTKFNFSVEALPPLPLPTALPGTIPESEGLAEAIHLLSCRPARSSIPQTAGHHYMPHWSETHEERMHRRMMYPGPPSQRLVYILKKCINFNSSSVPIKLTFTRFESP